MRETDIKEKILTDKKYGLRDYLYIPFSVYPFGCLLKLLTKLVSALLPALQVLTIAAFIDRVTLVVQGKAGGNEVYVPLLLLACILAFTYLNGQLIAFLNLKTELRLAGTSLTKEGSWNTGILKMTIPGMWLTAPAKRRRKSF